MTAPIAFDNSYARLPERFYARQPPRSVAAPSLIRVNHGLARRLGLDPEMLESEQLVAALAGNGTPEQSEPLAMAYAGHQFGGWNPQLGDGRALLLGEVVAPDGARFDIQLKGSGPTPFSRGGDGRAPLGAVLREYLLCEGMAALGVPTTRALAAVATGEAVYREQALPGAVLTRVAASHVRVGTFQYFAARQDTEALRLLADHVIARHYAELAGTDGAYLSLIRAVVRRQARLIAKWMALGFIHGVMNTDNMTISGETIDYGPCAFMDAYHPATVYSSIDQHGRYAYDNQARVGQWNLAALAQALLDVLPGGAEASVGAAQAAIDEFPAHFQAAWLTEMRAKLGLSGEEDGDTELVDELLTVMADAGADFTLTFRGLADGRADEQFPDPAAFQEWQRKWRDRGGGTNADLSAVNPLHIPRNHLVEAAIKAGTEGDFGTFHELADCLQHPFSEQEGRAHLAAPPRPEEIVRQTFCGT